MVPKLLAVAVEFYRAPTRFGYLTDPSQPLPNDFSVWLSEACAAISPRNVDATATALGTEPRALHEAFLYFLRHTLLVSQADHYRVLGLSRDCSSDAIKQHHGLLVNLFHPDRMPGEDPGRVQVTARINAAYGALRDRKARARYDMDLAPSVLGAVPDVGQFAFAPPRDARRPIAVPTSPARGPRQRTLSFTLGALGAVVASAVMLPLFMQPKDPVLSMRHDRADLGVPRPAYLKQADPALASRRYEPAAEQVDPKQDVIPRGLSAPPSKGAVDRPQSAPPPTQHRRVIPRETTLTMPDAGPERRPDKAQIDGKTLQDRQREQHPEHAAARLPQAGLSTHNDASGTSRVSDRSSAFRTPDEPPASSSDTAEPSRRRASTPAAAVTTRPARPAEKDVAGIESRSFAEKSRRIPPTQRAQNDPPGVPAASQVITRLRRFYNSGDLDGLTRLFTVNAVLNHGAGRAHIRQWYSTAFERDQQRLISISNLRWREGDHERLIGSGQIRLMGRESRTAKWRRQQGTVEIELVPWQDQYYIGKLIHHLSGK